MSRRGSFSTAAALAVAMLVTACNAAPATTTAPGAGTITSAPPGPSPSTVSSVPSVAPTTAPVSPRPLGDGPWIAYQAMGDHGYGVQLLPLDGGSGRPGTSGALGGYQEHPDWSPDGQRFVFTRKRTDASGELWIADAATGTAERVVDCIETCAWVDEPAWSPDGTMIAFQRATMQGSALRSTVEILELDRNSVRLVTAVPERRIALAPRWSADEKRLGIEEISVPEATVDAEPDGGTVAIIELAHPDAVRPLLPMTRKANNPDWSPDGRRILFSMPDTDGEPGGGRSDLWTVRPDGTDLTRVTHTADGGGTAVHPTFTPDGSGIVFAYGQDADAPWTMAVVGLDGRELRSATGDRWVEGVHPRMRPTP